MSSSEPVIWDKRGIKSPHLIPGYIDAFARAQIKEQVAKFLPFPNAVYTPVSWEQVQKPANYARGDLWDEPFIALVMFVSISNPPGVPVSDVAEAGVVLKDAKQIIGLTPGYTQTPCKSDVINDLRKWYSFFTGSLAFPALSFAPDTFERDYNKHDPTQRVGLITGDVRIEYMVSYWKRPQKKRKSKKSKSKKPRSLETTTDASTIKETNVEGTEDNESKDN
ncbi:hypothetical protein DFH06DRAFT_738851 [Mycena polygramma]|nr:hypothetical protein DFH06DRAFT_738851 [Mycena polygramma]